MSNKRKDVPIVLVHSASKMLIYQFLLTVLILLHRPHSRLKQKLRNIKYPEYIAQFHMKNIHCVQKVWKHPNENVRNVKKSGRRLGRLIIVVYLTSSRVIWAFFGMSGPV
jgi:hypothetical protein